MSEKLLKESWVPGEIAHFEYHCLECHKSSDAELWYRSHQEVTILAELESDVWEGSTIEERSEDGCPKVYKVKFADGLEGAATEDELFTDPVGFYRPEPPVRPF